MKAWKRLDPAGFSSAIRFNRALANVDDSAREYILDQVRAVDAELRVQNAIDKQLDAELQACIYAGRRDGTQDSLLFKTLPAEIRHLIFSHVVQVEQSVHIFPPKGNETHGFRLSLCHEGTYDFEAGTCNCNDSMVPGRSVQSEFFSNSLFLVSQTVRREALDAFFMTNKFTFTCLYEFTRFSSMFATSTSRIQQLRIFERVDDYPTSEYRRDTIQNARLKLKALKHLELRLYIASWSAYEELYEDGLIDQLLDFALGPPPPEYHSKKRSLTEYMADETADGANESNNKCLQNHTTSTDPDADESTTETQPNANTHITNPAINPKPVSVLDRAKCLAAINHDRTSSKTCSSTIDPTTPFPIPPLRTFTPIIKLRNSFLAGRLNVTANNPRQKYYDDLYQRLSAHLTDVFMDAGRRYRVVEDVPRLGPKPKVKVREDEKPLTGAEKRGILFMRD